MKNKFAQKPAFTLVELLVVMVIIAMLAALLFPVIGAAVRMAKKAKAKVEVTNLATSFNAFYTEFGIWPPPTPASVPGTAPDANIHNITTCTFTNGKNILFYDFSSKKECLDAQVPPNYLDPWKNPYRFRVDSAYKNYVTDPFTGGSVSKGALVWSVGPDANVSAESLTSDAGAQPNSANRVTSW